MSNLQNPLEGKINRNWGYRRSIDTIDTFVSNWYRYYQYEILSILRITCMCEVWKLSYSAAYLSVRSASPIHVKWGLRLAAPFSPNSGQFVVPILTKNFERWASVAKCIWVDRCFGVEPGFSWGTGQVLSRARSKANYRQNYKFSHCYALNVVNARPKVNVVTSLC